MKISLVLCLTHSAHKFNCLKSYKDIVDEVIIYDTGLLPKELNKIKNIFKDTTVIHEKDTFIDFSTMRNRALDLVSDDCSYVIFPDDSYRIESKKNDIRQIIESCHCHDYDVIICDLITVDGKTINVSKIFRPHMRFKYKVYEKLITTNRTKFIKVPFYFVDEFEDLERSLTIRSKLINLNNQEHIIKQSNLIKHYQSTNLT